MRTNATYRPPRGWLRVGKYLLPLGVRATDRLPSRAPRRQLPIEELAAECPRLVQYQRLGEVRGFGDFSVVCHHDRQREVRTIPAQSFPKPFVAKIENGISYGRQCCVIGPERTAVRETGFYLDGAVQTSKIPVSRLSLRYWRKRWGSDVTSRWWMPAAQRVSGRVAVLNARYCHNFFHWMIEILPRLELLEQAGLAADYYLVDCLKPYQRQALVALGLRPEQWIQPHCLLTLAADEIVLPSLPTPDCLRSHAARLLQGLAADRPVEHTRRIYITRSATGTRTLENEAEIEQLLRARGFETHAMELYPLAKQARLIREAEIVVGTHGAGLSNLIFARPGTQIIEFVPAERFNYACYPKRTRFFGLEHQLVFAGCPEKKQVLHVALDDVAAALAEAEQRLAERLAA